MSLLVLSATDVARLVSTLSPHDLIYAITPAFAAVGQSVPLHRQSVETPERTTLFMPSTLSGVGTGIKVVTVPAQHNAQGLPASTLLLDETSGAVEAIINATDLTALRTAAGSALATRLAGVTNPELLVMFGAGRQAEAHIRVLCQVYKSIKKCTIINREENERVEQLCKSMQTSFPQVQIVSGATSLEAVVTSADIICTATSSRVPLFKGRWVKAGAHVNLIGSYQPVMVEVDTELLRRAHKIIVDSKEACLREAGEIIDAGLSSADLIEIGALVGAGGDGEEINEKGEVTIFKSVGIGLQDIAIARAVVNRAKEMNVGNWVAYN